jgi:hypothetical protein
MCTYIKYFYSYFNSLYYLNHVLFLKLNILNPCIGSKTVVISRYIYVSFVMHLPEGDHTIGRNMQEVYDVCIIPSYTYVRGARWRNG